MRKIVYELLEALVPSTNGNILVNDYGARGIKLKFSVKTYNVFQLGRLKITWISPIQIEEKIYLRPLKEAWSIERGRLPKNHWWKTTEALTGPYFWWEVACDYGPKKTVRFPIIRGEEPVKDHALIKQFNKRTEKFHFYINNQILSK